MKTSSRQLKRAGLGVLLAGFLAGCGGGGAATSNAVPPPANNPPTISGTPATAVTEDQPYAFIPTANDADGNTLTFSIAPLPVWASFEPTTGSLTGTPTGTHVGTTFGVTISVTDGSASASLAPFDLEVQQIPLGSATVSWDVPLTNADDSPLTDLDKYRVHYGTASQDYSLMVEVNDPNATEVTINGLQAGTWFFAVQAVDQSDNASAFSAEVSKEIDP